MVQKNNSWQICAWSQKGGEIDLKLWKDNGDKSAVKYTQNVSTSEDRVSESEKWKILSLQIRSNFWSIFSSTSQAHLFYVA